MYAGRGMGADVAAWKQAAAAELGMTMEEYASYADALLDLVKAFDKVPLWLLVREAIAMGYPLEVLRFRLPFTNWPGSYASGWWYPSGSGQ